MRINDDEIRAMERQRERALLFLRDLKKFKEELRRIEVQNLYPEDDVDLKKLNDNNETID